jgi:phosphoglycerol transferase MdoB-like AlkP superfamily enzyme
MLCTEVYAYLLCVPPLFLVLLPLFTEDQGGSRWRTIGTLFPVVITLMCKALFHFISSFSINVILVEFRILNKESSFALLKQSH